jgi:hypothetical protein
MWTIYHAALEYYAIQILFSCLDDSKDTFPSWLDTALTDLLGIAYKALGENPVMVYRYAWPLTVASIRIRDPIHRDWVAAQVKRASVLVGNPGIPRHLLEKSPSPTTPLFLDLPHQEESEVQIT